ncbi:MAG: TolC family protein [Longimicrobiales bacterium]|nr:TolC family protein [Longimicrobiales bacterium]
MNRIFPGSRGLVAVALVVGALAWPAGVPPLTVALGIGIDLGVGTVGLAAQALPSGEPAQASPDVWRLTLDEALAVARQNNPAYLQARERIGAADWAVREAYGNFLPGASASMAVQYQGAGNQRIGVYTGSELGGTSTDYYLSYYSLGLGYSLSGSDFYRLSSSRAGRRAAGAQVEAAAFELEARVTNRYLEALRTEESAEVARSQLDRADENLELVRARFAAGAVPGTDVRQAEVERGRAAVAVVRAENQARVERFRLMEEMGRHTTREIALVDELEVFEPEIDADGLVARALEAHPRLHSARETERAGRARVREAQSSYLPTLSANVGWSGFARELGNTDFLIGRAQSSVESERESCMFYNQISAGLSQPLDGYPRSCSSITLSESDRAQLLESNKVFPFDFEKQPISATLQLSFPIFEGFSRQRRVEEAQVQVRTAEESRRGEELRLRTEVVTAHGNLEAAWEVVEIEERNRELAQEQLQLARERYSLGAAPFLELLDAQNSVAAAERDYLNAVYDFHAARADLERASGLELNSDGLDTALAGAAPTNDTNE